MRATQAAPGTGWQPVTGPPALIGHGTLRWPVTQLSVGSVTSTSAVRAVSVSVESASGVWQNVLAAPGSVGDGGAAPYLLAELPASTEALGVDVSVRTSGTAEVAYVNAIGRTSG